MVQSRRNLKITSIVVLIFVAVSLLNILSELLYGDINNADIPEGSSENIILIAKIILLSVSILLLLPKIYIGIKGLRMAKYPNSSRAHIIWATIIFVFAVIDLISPVTNILSGNAVKENARILLSVLVDVVLYYDYIKYAKAVSAGR